MKKAALLLVALLIVASCTENNSVQPPPTIDPFDWCGNGAPLPPEDSARSLWPSPRYRFSQLRISSNNGWWAGEYEGWQRSDGQYGQGIFVYDPVNDKPIARYDNAWAHSWSPDGKQLLLVYAFAIYVVDIPTMELHQLTDEGYSNLAYWSTDGTYIYLRHAGTYRMKPDGSDKQLVTTSLWNAKVLDEKRLFTVYKDTLRLYNLESETLDKIYKPEMDDSHLYSLYDISPNSDFIIFQTREDGSIPNPWGNGIWLMDTETWAARKIRGAQWWNHQYYPTWASNSSFYASVFCRKDSSSMIWEFDLNGEPIRQITTKEMNVWLE